MALGMATKLKIALPTIAIGVILDQWSKIYAVNHISSAIPDNYLGGFFRLQYAQNSGAFLSAGSGLSDGARWWIFVVGVSLLVLGMIWYLFRARDLSTIEVWAFTLAITGGIGNLIDRIAFGYVRDFMNIGIGPLRTGIFNVADIAISTAAILLVWFLIKGTPRK
jgi:signal peptidase II